MRLLLDTHIFLWYIASSSRLNSSVAEAIRNPGNDVYLSVVSFWEAVIKYDLGKLPLPSPPAVYLPAQRTRHEIRNLDLDERSVIQVARLPLLHRDPFDRAIIAQALAEDMTIVTADSTIAQYSVQVLPA